MESFPVFFKFRALTFTCIILISFLWTVLLTVQVYTRWDISDPCSRSLTAVFIFTNTTTILILPFLLLLEFRVWLDAARILLLMVAQIGSAAAFTYWNPRIQCLDQTIDQLGVCKLINMYTLMGCWIVPAILVLYASYFAAMVHRQSRTPVVVESREKLYSADRLSISPGVVDPEIAIASPYLPARTSRVPISPPRILTSDSLPFSRSDLNSVSPITAFPPLASRASHIIVFQAAELDKRNSRSPQRDTSLGLFSADSMSSPVQPDSTTRRSERLSKPLPPWCI